MIELRARAREIVENPALTYRQRMHYLATLAEDALEYPALSEAASEALNKRIICDMYEGAAPHRPRYVLPDYALALSQGSEHLELDPPRDLDEALDFLLILYGNVPSITGYPVYLGDLDTLLEPFADGVPDAALRQRLRRFWIAIDRMIPDAFAHADLGPDPSRIGAMILELERELHQVVPNLTLRVDPDRTTEGFLRDAVETVFEVGKPHFVNHPLMVGDLGDRYAAVSCYNSLKIGGGSHTLTRINLKEVVANHRGGVEELLEHTLPLYVGLNAELTEARVRHLVERARFYDHHFLATEGLISLDRFSAMFGIFGIAEAVDALMDAQGKPGRYGHDYEANELSYRIVETVADLVASRPMPYCDGNDGVCFLHAQSGIDLDVDVTAGARVPIGTEPALLDHIETVAPHHRHFAAGISDIFHFDDTARSNPQAVVDIIRGAMASGMRDFTYNLDSNEFVRITGYLVRKSDVADLADGARHASTYLGAGAIDSQHVTERRAQRIISHERAPRPRR